ncbi:MAG: GTP-binding protein, partial [Gammaproteobacteria bacterium]
MSKNGEIKKFINKQNSLDTLRFITCGSVDDGKSTLLGRMLYEAHLIFDDQVENLVSDSKKIGTQGGGIDFALLVDGLAAEREQGITIDVAYRFFSTEKRKFIVADSPGHEQYTRNMVTAASNAEVAIILIDARNGILPQTKRHSFIASLVGIKKIIVAVNKMDLMNFEKEIFEEIMEDYKKNVLSEVEFDEVSFIPVSALGGDNIIINSTKTPWYSDKPLMSMLESINIDKKEKDIFSMPVQYVNRPNLNFRGFSGTISSGSLSINDEILVSSSTQTANVSEIYIADKNTESCKEGDAVTITLNKEIDISRGDILFNKSYEVKKSNAFLTNLIWFNEKACFSNRSYILKSGNKQTGCEILKIKNKIKKNNSEKIAAGSLEMNDIAECEL